MCGKDNNEGQLSSKIEEARLILDSIIPEEQSFFEVGALLDRYEVTLSEIAALWEQIRVEARLPASLHVECISSHRHSRLQNRRPTDRRDVLTIREDAEVTGPR